MEVVIAIAAKIVEDTVGPVGQWLCYSCHYKSNKENLKNQETVLRDAKNRVQQAVEAASNNGHEIRDDVKTWLTKVDDIIHQLATKKFGGGEEEAESRNSTASCLNLKQRHQISWEAKKMVGYIAELLKQGNFDRVSYLPALEAMVTTRYMDYVALESRMSVVKGIMEALGEANINKIGVWGMPGVGKSTLMREIVSKVKEDKLFHEVAMAIVSESPDVRRIQGAIAYALGLNFDQETDGIGRASQLQQRLSKDEEKNILVILDDIWKELDLVDIGITPSERCKIVLTSRNRDVLTCGMGTQKDFALQPLLKEEAWDLFEKMAGYESVKDPNVRATATEVAEECAGLPIALVTVSKALKNKSLSEWKDALRRLRRLAPRHDTEMLKSEYSAIKLSYMNLESQELKSLLLLCAQLPAFFCYRDLLKYCYGYGLFHGIDTLEEARNILDTLLCKLRDSCLLLESSNQFCMHGVVRNVAMIIASNDHNMFVMRDDGGLKALPDADSLKRCETLSILGGDIDQLPNKMECPQLRFFHVYFKDRSLQIPDTLFQGMEKLKVLDLTKMQLSPIPSSLLLLRNLQTLCLDNCVLGDIAGIGELKNLVILSLLRSDISKLPREIGSLVRLRLLDLSNCSKLEVIPPNVLSSLVELEELYMENSFVQWEAEGLITQRSNNANLAELKSMLRLTTLEMHIRDACMLPKDLQFEKLERYNILVGDVWDWSDKHECSRTLKLKLKTSFQSEVGIKMLLNKTECLYLDELKGVKSVLHELDREGFQQLKHLHIQNNDEINYIIISSPMHISTISFPALETFLLKNMIGLEDIFHGQLHSTSLRNLRVVKVENCEKLKFVFPSSVAMGLSQLQELQIRECSNMGAIVVNEGGEIEATDMILFPQLRLLALEHLPKLMSFLRTKNSLGTEAGEIGSEGTLDFDMPIFLHEQVVFSNLESLELSSLDLEEIEHNQHRARFSCRLTTMEAMTRFQNLSNLEVQGSCDKKYLLSFSTARFMVHLKHLHISECKAMEEVLVAEEIAAAREITKEVFPRLECLQLTDLPSLKRFCVGCNIQFPSLESLWIEHCPKLVTFIFNPASSGATTAMQPLFNVEVAFPCLKKLAICRMDYLKHIWQNQFAESSFCNLQIIKVELCENLVSIFQSDMLTRFQSVEELFVIDCSSLQEVFELQELNVNENQAVTTIPLKVLFLDRLPQMKHVWSKDPKAVFSFKNLKRIWAGGCENLRSFFPGSVARSLMQLEHLAIIDCGVEEIVEGEGRDICHGQLHSTSFRDLRVLKLEDREKLKFVFSSSIARGLSLLEKLEIRRCNNMGAIVMKEEKDGIEDGDVILFHQLQTLVLEDLPELMSFLSTRSLFMIDCGQIIEEGNRDLHMPLLHHQVSFPSLQTLCMKGLPKIKHVWSNSQEPKTVFRCLEQLKILEIEDCGVEEIVASGGGRGGGEPVARTILEFPRVTDLKLKNLKRLEWFYKGVHVTKWPMLEMIWIEVCEKVEIFASGLVSFEETIEERQSEMSIKQPIFLVDELSFSSLKKLHIQDMYSLEIIWQDQVAASSFFKNIQDVQIHNCEKLLHIFQSNFHTTTFLTQRLTRLFLWGCSSLETIFRNMEGHNGKESQVLIAPSSETEESVAREYGTARHIEFPILTQMTLVRLPKLKWILEGVDTNLECPSLEILELWECEQVIWASKLASSRSSQETSQQNQLQTHIQLPLPNLLELELGICHVKLPWTSFKKLRVLVLENCEKLRFVFSSSIARGLSLLEKLEIRRCNNMSAIVVKEEKDGIEDGFVIFFYQLQTLVLKDLPKLVSFLSTRSSFMTNCGQIIAEGNRDLHIPLLHHQVSFPSLQTLRMEGLPKIKHVWSCGQEPKTIFRCIEQLKILEIEDCGVEEIVAGGGGGGGEPLERTILVFPRVTNLNLINLKRLKWFYKGIHVSKWPMLKEMWIEGCEKVKIFASGVVSFKERVEERPSEMSIKQPLFFVDEDELSFSSLKKLLIEDMDKLEIISHDQVTVSSFSKNIEDVEIRGCQKLLHVSFLSTISSLMTDCGQIIAEGNCDLHMPLLHHQGKLPSTSFKKLRVLKLENCEKLRFVFSSSIARGLSLLEGLEIRRCNNVGAIVVKEEKDRIEDGDVILFHQLQTLVLEDLPELVSFLSTRHSFMTDCGQIIAEGNRDLHMPLLHHQGPQVLIAPSSRTEESVAREDGTIRHIEFPILTEMRLARLPKLKWILEGVHTNLECPSLEKLRLSKCEQVIWASKFASNSSSQETSQQNQLQTCIQLRLPNLLELQVWISGREQIFPYELVDPVPRLRRLELYSLSMLTHLWKEDSTQPCPLFHNLEFLHLSRCGKLKNIVPSSVFLQNLTELHISYCDGLINLLTSSTAKTLVQLKKMTVMECKRITEIVAMEDAEANVTITFDKLAYLQLDGLPNLTHFCSGPYSFGFPSLKEVFVTCCPEMKPFYDRVSSTLELKVVYLT